MMINPLRRNEIRVPAALATTLVATVAVLTACGGGSGSSAATTSAAAATPSPSVSSSTGARRGGFGEFFEQSNVQQCLKAAGVTVPTFAARPSGARPSGSFVRPSGSFTRPSGARPSGGFGGSGDFTKIEAALKACGITLPTGGGRFGGPNGSGAPAASGSPASS